MLECCALSSDQALGIFLDVSSRLQQGQTRPTARSSSWTVTPCTPFVPTAHAARPSRPTLCFLSCVMNSRFRLPNTSRCLRPPFSSLPSPQTLPQRLCRPSFCLFPHP